MSKIYDIIAVPMGYVLRYLSQLVNNNFAVAIFIFTLLINLAMIPLTVKSQKSAVQQLRIKPKLDEIKKKCGDDKQKYSREMQELYTREGVSASGGCLPLILRFVFMMGIYWAIADPLRYICKVPAATVNAAVKKFKVSRAIELLSYVKAGKVASIPASVLDKINFNFFGIDLTQTPHFSLDFSKAEWIWIIPFISFAAQMISSIISLKIQKKTNPDAPNMAGMMLTMPLISLWIGFSFPGALGIYWACSAIISGAIQAVVTLKYGPQTILAKEQTKSVFDRYKFEETRRNSANGID